MASNMNDLLASLDDDDETKSAAEHVNRLDQYKNTGKNASSQEVRRLAFLKNLKEKRQNYVNLARNLALGDVAKAAQLSDDEEDEPIEMECEEIMSKEKLYRKAASSTRRNLYRNQLMLSEWMLEIPSDLESKWLVKLCPVAKRCLVVASNGETKAYSRRTGKRVNLFSSLLPGGSKDYFHKSSNFTILDCLYSLQEKTFYILDIMCWNGYEFYNSEAEFRFYWLESKLNESPGLNVKSSQNWFPFVGLKTNLATPETLHRLLNSELPFKSDLDGVLFFHKQGHYVLGVTPIVTWLKPFMMTEVFGITVPDTFNEKKPESYISFQSFAKNELDKINKQEKLKSLKEMSMNID